MILNSIEKPLQKHQNLPQKRSRHNSTSKQTMQKPLNLIKQPNVQPSQQPKQKTNENQQFLRWIKQIYKNKSIKQELLKKSQEHADEIYHRKRNINKLQLYRDQLNKRIAELKKLQAHDEPESEEDIVMERTEFQSSEDIIDLSKQRSAVSENDGIGSVNTNKRNGYLV